MMPFTRPPRTKGDYLYSAIIAAWLAIATIGLLLEKILHALS